MGKSETVDEDGGILDEDAVWRREEKGSSVLFFSSHVALSRILVPIFFMVGPTLYL
jgi:hypothetical protein